MDDSDPPACTGRREAQAPRTRLRSAGSAESREGLWYVEAGLLKRRASFVPWMLESSFMSDEMQARLRKSLVNMVTVANFFDARSAELARIALEGSGVSVSLRPEAHASVTVPASLGIRLEVSDKDLETARAILQDLQLDLGGELF